MKFLIVFALCVAAATARFVVPDVAAAEAAEIQQILDLIHHPNTDPATAAALLAMLEEILAPSKPVEEGIAVGPIIVETDEGQHGINVDPVIIEEETQHGISVNPVVIEPVAPEAPAASSPLVNIVINVNTNTPKDVAVEGSPVVARPEPVEEVVIDPTPIVIVDQPEEPIHPVIVAPIIVPEPAVNLPGPLN